ncbi:MAG: M28 family peptidase [Ilumatobacteraceae bacterium]
MHRILIGTVCAVALVAAACSSDTDTASVTTVESTTPVATTTPDTAPPTTTAVETTVPVVDGPADARGIVEVLASDELTGRDDDTPGSEAAQAFLYAQISAFTEPAFDGRDGIDGYLQELPRGHNLIGVIPGTDLADQYVVIGAHYDHIGSDCPTNVPGDSICNGATDNAAGVAVAVSAARALAASGSNRRTVILALWDQEEDGLVGSAFYTANPVVPLAQTVAYINFDIQGSDFLPSLADSTIAVGAETGGVAFVDAVTAAASGSTLKTAQLSVIFGQGRSDHVNFVNGGVSSVFFTDATNGCYHTSQDDVAGVNFDKLDQQVNTATALLADIASTETIPVFDAAAPVATYADAVALLDFAGPAQADFGLLSNQAEADAKKLLADLQAIVDAGPAAFNDASIGTLLGGAAAFVEAVTQVACLAS